MTRLFSASATLLMSLVLMGTASAMEPLQRSQSTAPVGAASSTSLDLSSEQAHFSASSTRIGQTQSATEHPSAPGEEGRAPKGHSLLDLDL